ncbi:MAG: hypothetical protein LBD23_09750 [Oscillospiraceae bacterium]|jgi:hypothetical protein|nr:hypothetical protein [Oscillospiraceae bacterium]
MSKINTDKFVETVKIIYERTDEINITGYKKSGWQRVKVAVYADFARCGV